MSSASPVHDTNAVGMQSVTLLSPAGYTAWDATSPAFLMRGENNVTLCIPTAFVSWTGEALDTKIPLLRSVEASSKQAIRILRIFGADKGVTRVYTTVGPEQEYFLVDRNLYYKRPDLVTCRAHAVRRQAAQGPAARRPLLRHHSSARARLHGRGRAGALPARRAGQDAAQRGGARPVRDRAALRAEPHRERPSDADDGDLKRVAPRYGLQALLHEKPFAGVNGSGKHNNWSMTTDTGRQPARSAGRHPHKHAVPGVPVRRSARWTSTPICSGPPSPRRPTTIDSAPTRPRRRSSRSSWARC